MQTLLLARFDEKNNSVIFWRSPVRLGNRTYRAWGVLELPI